MRTTSGAFGETTQKKKKKKKRLLLASRVTVTFTIAKSHFQTNLMNFVSTAAATRNALWSATCVTAAQLAKLLGNSTSSSMRLKRNRFWKLDFRINNMLILVVASIVGRGVAREDDRQSRETLRFFDGDETLLRSE